MITKVQSNGLSYEIRNDEGEMYKVNHRFLRPWHELPKYISKHIRDVSSDDQEQCVPEPTTTRIQTRGLHWMSDSSDEECPNDRREYSADDSENEDEIFSSSSSQSDYSTRRKSQVTKTRSTPRSIRQVDVNECGVSESECGMNMSSNMMYSTREPQTNNRNECSLNIPQSAMYATNEYQINSRNECGMNVFPNPVYPTNEPQMSIRSAGEIPVREARLPTIMEYPADENHPGDQVSRVSLSTGIDVLCSSNNTTGKVNTNSNLDTSILNNTSVQSSGNTEGLAVPKTLVQLVSQYLRTERMTTNVVNSTIREETLSSSETSDSKYASAREETQFFPASNEANISVNPVEDSVLVENFNRSIESFIQNADTNDRTLQAVSRTLPCVEEALEVAMDIVLAMSNDIPVDESPDDPNEDHTTVKGRAESTPLRREVSNLSPFPQEVSSIGIDFSGFGEKDLSEVNIPRPELNSVTASEPRPVESTSSKPCPAESVSVNTHVESRSTEAYPAENVSHNAPVVSTIGD